MVDKRIEIITKWEKLRKYTLQEKKEMVEMMNIDGKRKRVREAALT